MTERIATRYPSKPNETGAGFDGVEVQPTESLTRLSDPVIQAFKMAKTSDEIMFLLYVRRFGLKMAIEEAAKFHWKLRPQFQALLAEMDERGTNCNT